MCLASPGRVLNLEDNGKTAIVVYGKKTTKALNLVKAKKNDWVLVQQGTIVEKIDKKSAKKSIRAWREASRN